MLRVRSIFLSDIHLGNPGCHAELLLCFLRHVRTQNLFLIGDIIDLECMARKPWWAPTHTDVLRTVLGIARQGGRVVYIPGNHDARFRAHCGRTLAGIEIRRFVVHEGVTRRRYLLLHGDEFDGLLACGTGLARIGARAYRLVIRMNSRLNRLRQRLGYPYWPFASRVKQRFGSARQYMARFRDTVVHTARGCAVDGVVCGHIHQPEQLRVEGIEYLNTGDWVENCTAIVEHLDGRMELIDWARQVALLDAREPLLQPLGKVA